MKFKLLMITLGYMSLSVNNNNIENIEPVTISPVKQVVVSEVSQPVVKIEEIIKDSNLSIELTEEQTEENFVIEEIPKVPTPMPPKPEPIIVEPEIKEPVAEEPVIEEPSTEIDEEYVVLEDKYALVWEYKDGTRRVGGENGTLYKWCDETNSYVALDKDGNFYTYKLPTMEEMASGATCIGSAIFCSESGSYESAKPE